MLNICIPNYEKHISFFNLSNPFVSYHLCLPDLLHTDNFTSCISCSATNHKMQLLYYGVLCAPRCSLFSSENNFFILQCKISANATPSVYLRCTLH